MFKSGHEKRQQKEWVEVASAIGFAALALIGIDLLFDNQPNNDQ